MFELLERNKAQTIRLCTSQRAKAELERRKGGPGRLQKVIYLLLEDVAVVDEEYRAASMLGTMGVGSAGPIVRDEMLGKLTDLLPGEDDARHIFQAAGNDVTYFVTCDRDTIFKHAKKIEPIADLLVRSPSQLIADLASAES